MEQVERIDFVCVRRLQLRLRLRAERSKKNPRVRDWVGAYGRDLRT
jgi:hypothetical protein